MSKGHPVFRRTGAKMDGSAANPIVYFDEAGGPYQHICPVRLSQPREIWVGRYMLQSWLDRRRLLGLITADGALAIEQLIEDLQ